MFRPGKILALALALAGSGGVYAVAQQRMAPEGPFTADQAKAGAAEYAASCAGCHMATLAGSGEAPALAGSIFMSGWGKRSTADFYRYISTSMPQGAAGSLSAEAYGDITAFILQANGAKAGAQRLTKTSDVVIGSIADGKSAAPAAAEAKNDSAAKMPRGSPRIQSIPQGLTVKGTLKTYAPVTEAMLKAPADADWLMYRRTYQGWSYSPLTQITDKNVGALQLKWSWILNDDGANETTPIVHDGIMFLESPGNIVQALNAATGELIWQNRIGPAGGRGQRSIALYEDKVYIATTEAKLFALDARTGKVVWQSVIADASKGYDETGGVMVIHGKVLVGLSGCEHYTTTNCYISAYDARTGQRDWKFYTTALRGTPGGDTWRDLPDDRRAGGDTWIAGTYDPDLNTTYWGVAQAKPWFRASRGTYDASTLYTSSTLALDPDTGKLKWFYQHVPGESLDMDEVFERVLIDHGDQKTLMTIGKAGVLWKLDRATGKFLDAKPTELQNLYTLDPKTGIANYRSDIVNQKTNQFLSSCPGPAGGKDWGAASYSPGNDLLLIPLTQSCVMIAGQDVEKKLGGGGQAGFPQKFYFMPGTNRNMGNLVAYNTKDMKQVWSAPQSAPFLTAVLSTSGGVAFVGDYDRMFKAFDVKTGKKLWETRLGTTVQGHPVSFSIDGKQYIAITTGLGAGSPQNKPDVMLPNLRHSHSGQELYVFGLPDASP